MSIDNDQNQLPIHVIAKKAADIYLEFQKTLNLKHHANTNHYYARCSGWDNKYNNVEFRLMSKRKMTIHRNFLL